LLPLVSVNVIRPDRLVPMVRCTGRWQTLGVGEDARMSANHRRTKLPDDYEGMFRPDRPVKITGPGLREVKLRCLIPTDTEDGTTDELAEANQLRDALRSLGFLNDVHRTQETNLLVVSFTFRGVFSSDRALMDHLFARLHHVISGNRMLQEGFCSTKPTWIACKGDDDFEIQSGGFAPPSITTEPAPSAAPEVRQTVTPRLTRRSATS
jgi:hypothetical protein